MQQPRILGSSPVFWAVAPCETPQTEQCYFLFFSPPKLLAGSEANPAGSENHPAARRHSQLAPIPSARSLLLPAGSLPHPVGSEPLYGSEALPASFKAFLTGPSNFLQSPTSSPRGPPCSLGGPLSGFVYRSSSFTGPLPNFY